MRSSLFLSLLVPFHSDLKYTEITFLGVATVQGILSFYVP